MPTAMLSSLNLKEGDDVLLTCDEDRIYLAKNKDKLPKMVALFSTPPKVHKVSGVGVGKKVTLCGLGGMGLGAMEFPWEDKYLEYIVCTGCLQGQTQFKKIGQLKDLI